MEPAPTNEQQTGLEAGTVTARRQKCVIRRHDDDERERYDASNEQCRDQPPKSAVLKPHGDTAEKADNRQWGLQPCSALVARRPLLSRHTRLESHACGMLCDVDIQSGYGGQSGKEQGDKMDDMLAY